jgi:DNA polymerase/3'-5' exonuclease PolX
LPAASGERRKQSGYRSCGGKQNSREGNEGFYFSYDEVDQIISKGETRSSVKLRTGLQVDLRIVEKNAFGAALMYFTGSKEHTVALRTMAQEQGLETE